MYHKAYMIINVGNTFVTVLHLFICQMKSNFIQICQLRRVSGKPVNNSFGAYALLWCIVVTVTRSHWLAGKWEISSHRKSCLQISRPSGKMCCCCQISTNENLVVFDTKLTTPNQMKSHNLNYFHSKNLVYKKRTYC